MTVDAENITLEATLPTRLVAQMEALVDQGWFPGIDEVIADAVRRFLETHSPELIEHYVWQDVEWGLRCTD